MMVLAEIAVHHLLLKLLSALIGLQWWAAKLKFLSDPKLRPEAQGPQTEPCRFYCHFHTNEVPLKTIGFIKLTLLLLFLFFLNVRMAVPLHWMQDSNNSTMPHNSSFQQWQGTTTTKWWKRQDDVWYAFRLICLGYWMTLISLTHIDTNGWLLKNAYILSSFTVFVDRHCVQMVNLIF